MEHIKKKKFTLLGLFMNGFYTFFIWPYPEHYPLLNHHVVRLVLIILLGVLASMDEKKESKNN